jgi:hypothetical protein
MKLVACFVIITFAAITLNAQPKPTTAADYNGTFQYAVSETNSAFPFVFTVVTETFEGGKLISTETLVDERQGAGVDRWVKTLEKGGKLLRSYSIMVGFGNNTYCSADNVTWIGPQKFVCPGPEGPGGLMRLYRPRQPDKAEYSVTNESLDGKPVKVYRKYAVFAASGPNGKASFEEETATIDSRGFFISVFKTEGTLDPKVVSLRRKQTWDFRTKFKPVVAPK